MESGCTSEGHIEVTLPKGSEAEPPKERTALAPPEGVNGFRKENLWQVVRVYPLFIMGTPGQRIGWISAARLACSMEVVFLEILLPPGFLSGEILGAFTKLENFVDQ